MKNLDIRDALVFGGITMMGYGIHLINVPAAFIVCGALLFWIGRPR